MVGWYASSATERKEHVESISVVEGGQLSFYPENIPFPSSTIFSSSPIPKLVSCRVSPRLKMLSVFVLRPTTGQVWHKAFFKVGPVAGP